MTQYNRRTLLVAGLITIVMSGYAGSHATWIYGKAVLAQYMLDAAWNKSQQSGQPVKPWSWADVSTVAKLTIPILDRSLIVLSDASGEAMAFGPGLVGGNPLSASSSTLAIGGHRDTHLGFLEHVPVGAHIALETVDQQHHLYELVDKQVVDTRRQILRIAKYTSGLVLITCFPFNASQTGGHYRMVARAIPVEPE